MNSLVTWVVRELMMLNWRDLVELCFFFTLFYLLFSWLAQSVRPQLLLWCYGYVGLIAAASLINATAISSFLLMMIPFACLLCLVVHQETLQKALFVPKRMVVATSNTGGDWLDTVARGCLHALHTKGAVICVIERADSIAGMMQSSAPFNAPLSYPLLVKTLALYEPISYIWVKEPGLLVALDAQWSCQEPPEIGDIRVQASWQRQAVMLTHKTDALVLYAHGPEQLFTLVAQGTLVEAMPIGTMMRILRTYIAESHIPARNHENSRLDPYKQQDHP
jgi:hypothetical protein